MAEEKTSVGTIQLDVEINQNSLNTEINKISKVFNNSFKNIFGGFMGQTSNFIKNSIGSIGKGLRVFAQTGAESNEKVAQSASKLSKEYEKTQQKINEIRNELAKLYAEQEEIIMGYREMPPLSGMTKEETLDELLKGDPKFNELSAQINKLETQLGPLIEKNKQLAAEMEQTGNSANRTNDAVNRFSKNAKNAGKEIEKATQKTKRFGNEMKKSCSKAAGFATMLDRTFRRVLRRLFIYNLLYRGIRGLISYMGAALKTNQQFVNSLNIVKANLRVAFQPIFDFILPALNALMRAVVTVTTYIASAISALFGKTYKQSFVAAKSMNNTMQAMRGVGKAAKKTGKEVEGMLAPFDEINQLSFDKDTGDAGAGGAEAGGFEMTMPDTSTIDLSGLERFKALLQPTIDALKRLKIALQPLKEFTAQGLKDFYNNFLVPVAKWTFGEGLPRFIDALANGLMKINWQSINDGLNKLWEALTPFAINVGEGLLWFWENVLVPLGTWTMNEIVPRFLEILANVISILNTVLEALKPLGTWLWDNFLKPLAEWTGGIILDVLDGINNGLKKLGDWIKEHQGAIQTITILAGSFAAAWGLVNGALKIWQGIGVIATGVINGFNAAVTFLTSPIGIAITVIGGLIAVGIYLYKNWDEVSAKLKDIWNNIKNVASTIWNNIKTSVLNKWNEIKTGINNTKNNLVNAIKSPFNIAKDWINGIIRDAKNWGKNLVQNIIDGINAVKDRLKRTVSNVASIIKDFLGFSSPTKKGPGSTADKWMPNLMDMLAQGIKDNTFKIEGAVNMTANSLTGIGNINTNTIANAVGNAMMNVMNNFINSSDKPLEVNLIVDGNKLGRVVINSINSLQRQSGKTLLEV